MTLYYVETGLGCNLIEARTKEAAEKQALREVGTHAGVQLTRQATEADIGWVRAMQGGQAQ
jgi:hypothetical protein